MGPGCHLCHHIVGIVVGWLVDVPLLPAIVIHQQCCVVACVVAWLC